MSRVSLKEVSLADHWLIRSRGYQEKSDALITGLAKNEAYSGLVHSIYY